MFFLRLLLIVFLSSGILTLHAISQPHFAHADDGGDSGGDDGGGDDGGGDDGGGDDSGGDDSGGDDSGGDDSGGDDSGGDDGSGSSGNSGHGSGSDDNGGDDNGGNNNGGNGSNSGSGANVGGHSGKSGKVALRAIINKIRRNRNQRFLDVRVVYRGRKAYFEVVYIAANGKVKKMFRRAGGHDHKGTIGRKRNFNRAETSRDRK